MAAHDQWNPKFQLAGEWLWDKRLLNKRIDIIILGTTAVQPSLYGGRYEGHQGYTVLQSLPTPTESIYVRVGPLASKLRIPVMYLFPARTSVVQLDTRLVDLDMVTEQQELPFGQAYGLRVLIIGPDYEGELKYIGRYGVITGKNETKNLPSHTAQVLVDGGWFDVVFRETSLCRSLAGPIEWDCGQTVQ